MTDRERRLEIAAKNPEQVIETPEERAERDRLRLLFENSNGGLNLGASYYEAGWKAAKAYYDVQDKSQGASG